MKMLLRRDKLGFGLKHDEVGIKILGDAALARVASGEPRRTLRHPPRDVCQCKSAVTSLGPHHRERQRETRNPAPGRSKAPLARSLHFGRTGIMIRRHQDTDSFSKPLPKLFAILPATARRLALEH